MTIHGSRSQSPTKGREVANDELTSKVYLWLHRHTCLTPSTGILAGTLQPGGLLWLKLRMFLGSRHGHSGWHIAALPGTPL